jgi:hypothetical protein
METLSSSSAMARTLVLLMLGVGVVVRLDDWTRLLENWS